MNELTDLRNAMTYFLFEKKSTTVTESHFDSFFDGSQFGTDMLFVGFKNQLMT